MKNIFIIPALIFALGAAEAKTVDRILAQVNDDIITLSEMNREMALARRELESKYSGEQLEQAIQKTEKQVLDGLIQDKLLVQKAMELGFNSNVDSRISSAIQQVMKDNNLKDTDELEKALAQQGMSMRDFRDQVRNQIIKNDLIDEFVRSRITLLTPEIEKYYKDHAADYTTPEEVSLSEILIPIEGDEKEAESRANDLHRRLEQGESFSSLASQYSKGPTASKGGGIGTYVLAKLNPATVQAIAGLKDGAITTPRKVKEGFVLYRVDSRKPEAIKPLSEVRNEIRGRLYERRFVPEYERYIQQLKEDAYIQIFSEIK
jgi:peptidyl-prolyl cis-trans isomerase SurA